MTRSSVTVLITFLGLSAATLAAAEPETAVPAVDAAPASANPAEPTTPAVAESAEALAVPAAGGETPAAPVESAPPADAQPAAPVAEATKPVSPKTDDGMVCRMEKPIGSNRMKRVCRPAADIEQTARRTQDAMRRLQRTGPAGESR